MESEGGFSASVEIRTLASSETILYAIRVEGDQHLLIGQHGANLAALQHLVRALVRQKTGERLDITVDVNDYFAEKADILIREADKAVAEAVANRISVALRPMLPYERKIIHSHLAKHDGVVTESTGVKFLDEENEGVAVGPVSVRAYLEMNDQIEETRQKLEESLFYLGMIQPLPAPTYKQIADQNWMEAWKASYKPIPIGKRLMIVPAWMDSPESHRATRAVGEQAEEQRARRRGEGGHGHEHAEERSRAARPADRRTRPTRRERPPARRHADGPARAGGYPQRGTERRPG